jgi:hypothetical protein
MEPAEIEELLARARDADRATAMQAAYDLASSGDPKAVKEAIAIIASPEDYGPNAATMASGGLVDASVASIDILLKELERDPLSPRGRAAVTVLGAIASEHGPETDPRLVPALIRATETALDHGTRTALPYVGALREAAWGGPVPGGTEIMRKVLDVAKSEDEPMVLTINFALEFMTSDPDVDVTKELEPVVAGLPADHRLVVVIRGFLKSKQVG